MNLNTLYKHLPFLKRLTSTLVCEVDGFVLRAGVFSKADGKLKLDAVAHSQNEDYQAAVAEVITSLRAQGWTGLDAVLITPAAFTTLIELPVSPKKPRNPVQMQEMVRWELDSLMLQHNGLSSVGQLLQALGHMNRQQTQEVLEHQRGKQKASSASKGYNFKPYCELAIEMGYISQAQADHCLKWQSWLRSDSDEISCGWIGQLASGASANVGDGQFLWLASGINTEVMQRWEAAFKKVQVELTDVYPLTGASSGLLKDVTNTVVLEQHANNLSGLHIEHGGVSQIRMQNQAEMNEIDALMDVYHAVMPSDAHDIHLAIQKNDGADVAHTIESITQKSVVLLQRLAADVSSTMQGVAHHLLFKTKRGWSCGIPVQGPKQPLWKNVEARAIVAGVSLLALVILLEIGLQISQGIAESGHEKVSAEKKVLDAAVAQVQSQIDAVKKVKDEIKAKKAELEQVNKRYEFFALELPARTVVVQSLLQALATTVNDDVVINVIEETPNVGIRLEGWALSEAAGQRFIQSFKEAIKPLGYELVQPLVRAQAGRMGLSGYGVTFRLLEEADVTPDDLREEQ